MGNRSLPPPQSTEDFLIECFDTFNIDFCLCSVHGDMCAYALVSWHQLTSLQPGDRLFLQYKILKQKDLPASLNHCFANMEYNPAVRAAWVCKELPPDIMARMERIPIAELSAARRKILYDKLKQFHQLVIDLQIKDSLEGIEHPHELVVSVMSHRRWFAPECDIVMRLFDGAGNVFDL